ncbi:MAG: type IV secretory system conjugative DNA transfer family protein [Clostridia bacterium]
MEILTMSSTLLKIAAVGCGVKAAMLGVKSFHKISKLGSAYNGKPKEIRDYLGDDGITLSKKIQLCEKSMYGHIGVFGKTGSYKSSGIYIPNLLSNDLPEQSSLIISDVKGELFEFTSWYQEHICGREIKVFCPMNPERSIGINPLAICRSFSDVRSLAQTLLNNADKGISDKSSGGAEWITLSMPLLTAALLYCRHKGEDQCNVTTALDLVITQSDFELEMLFRNTTIEIQDQWGIYKTSLGAPGLAGSIKSTLASALQSFSDYKIATVTSKNDFEPTELRKRPIALYIIYSETQADYLAPLMATVFSQLINFNLDYFDKNKNSLAIFNYLDEFGNLGYINGFNHIITAARSRKFSLNLCIHDVRQLFRLYDQDLTYTMLNNLTIKVVLPGISEPNTLDYISKICGECEIEVRSETKSGDKVTVSKSKQKKRLYTDNEIRCLKDKTCIIIVNNKQVVSDNLNIYFDEKLNRFYEDRIVMQIL